MKKTVKQVFAFVLVLMMLIGMAPLELMGVRTTAAADGESPLGYSYAGNNISMTPGGGGSVPGVTQWSMDAEGNYVIALTAVGAYNFAFTGVESPSAGDDLPFTFTLVGGGGGGGGAVAEYRTTAGNGGNGGQVVSGTGNLYDYLGGTTVTIGPGGSGSASWSWIVCDKDMCSCTRDEYGSRYWADYVPGTEGHDWGWNITKHYYTCDCGARSSHSSGAGGQGGTTSAFGMSAAGGAGGGQSGNIYGSTVENGGAHGTTGANGSGAGTINLFGTNVSVGYGGTGGEVSNYKYNDKDQAYADHANVTPSILAMYHINTWDGAVGTRYGGYGNGGAGGSLDSSYQYGCHYRWDSASYNADIEMMAWNSEGLPGLVVLAGQAPLVSIAVQKYTDDSIPNSCLDGFRFVVHEASNKVPDFELITDANGYAKRGGLPNGTYTVTEDTDIAKMDAFVITQTYCEGYQVKNGAFYPATSTTSTVIDANANGTYTAVFYNTTKKMTLALRKYDADMSEVQGNATLQGAIYGLFAYENDINQATQVATAETDENGNFAFPGQFSLTHNYYLKELAPPPGYLIDPNIQLISINPSTLTVELFSLTADNYTPYTNGVVQDYVQRAPIEIVKRDSVLKSDIVSPQGDASLAQTSIFNIIYSDANRNPSITVNNQVFNWNDVVETVSTDADGVARTSDLPYGYYRIVEVNPPEGYENADFDIAVANFEGDLVVNITANFTDEVERGYLTVRKADVHDEIGYAPEGDTTLVGTEFVVKNVSAAPVTLSEAQRTVGMDTEWLNPDSMASNGDWIYNPGSDMCKMYTFNEQGQCDTLELPYGTYEVRETQAPLGYLNDSQPQTVSLYENGTIFEVTSTLTFKNTPKSTKITVDKKDLETWAAAQGDGRLDNMTVSVKNVSLHPIYYEGNVIQPGEIVCRLVTDDTGFAESDPLPYGTYDVVEEIAPYGYEPAGPDVSFEESNHNSDGDVFDDTLIEVRDAIQRGTLRVIKRDTDTGDINQGDATFIGTTFEVYNASQHHVYLSDAQRTGDPMYVHYAAGTAFTAIDNSTGYLYNPGELICTVTTDEHSGTVAVDIPNLPFGSYEVIETIPPRGYMINDGAAASGGDAYHTTIALYDSAEPRPVIFEMAEAKCEDSVKRGKFVITKVDDYTGVPQGGATLAGAEFTIINRSMQPVWFVGGAAFIGDETSMEENLYYPGEVVQRILTDENGVAETGMLPYGTYEIIETGAPEGYLIGIGDGQEGSGWGTEYLRNYEFDDELDQFGDIIPQTDLEMKDSAIRGDLMFQKKNQKQENLPYIVFRMTSLETGESHIIVTDENGEINTSSSKWPHSSNTNANDAAVVGDTVIEDMLNPQSGVWFTGLADQQLEPIDSRGALPYGQYQLEELRSSANIDEQGDELILLNFVVTIEAPAYTVDYGHLVDLNAVKVESEMVEHYADRHIASDLEEVVLDEEVTLHHLIKDHTYLVKGRLVDAETGEQAVDADGEDIIAEYQFVARATEVDRINLQFVFNASNMAGRTLTAFDVVYDVKDEGPEEVAHHDFTNMSETARWKQSVSFPVIRTTLTGTQGEKELLGATDVTIVDVVYYDGVPAGTTYTMNATLMVKQTGQPARDAAGDVITASKTFVAESSSGSVEIPFEHIDLSNLTGLDLVCFEELDLYTDGSLVAEHKDIEDEDQTVSVPDIRTMALSENESKNILAGENQMIIDTVFYKNLIPGNTYKAVGTLHLGSTGSDMMPNGETYTVEKEFKAEDEEGFVELEFVIDATGLDGDTLVAFESLYNASGKIVAVHEDLDDYQQTIFVPSVYTSAESADGQKEVTVSDHAVVVDTVECSNLIVGDSYTVSGKLYNKLTGEFILDSNGDILTSEKTFEADAPNMTVTIEFVFDATNPDNCGLLVAFETLYDSEANIVGIHEDEDDEEQTVTVSDISTTATGPDREHHEILAEESVTIVDTVAYTGLIPGVEYTLVGKLMNKDTGREFIADSTGGNVQASQKFTPTEPNGTVEVIFEVLGSDLHNSTLVVFEKLYKGEQNSMVEILAHEDIDDVEQTVVFPEIRTTAASETAGDNIFAGENQKIVDKVMYSNLIPGNEYTVKGILMDKDGMPIVDDSGNNIESDEVTFIAEEASGSVTIEFEFDASKLAGHGIVAFEELYTGTTLIGKHEDIEDEDQTVYVPEIRTTAYAESFADGAQEKLAHPEGALVVDYIDFVNLIPGETYTVKGQLVNKETEEVIAEQELEVVISDDDENVIIEGGDDYAASGVIRLAFEDVDSMELNAGLYVVFEDVYDVEGVLIAEHKDIEDEEQTIRIPVKVRTTATDVHGDKDATYSKLSDIITIVDKVEMEGLVVGQEYTLKGKMYVKVIDPNSHEVTAVELTDGYGDPVVAELTFTAEAESESRELSFDILASRVTAKYTVVFEQLFCEDELVGYHEDINDEDQTVYIAANVKSHLYDSDMGSSERMMRESEMTALYDDLVISDLKQGIEYEIVAYLVDQETGEIIKDAEGNDVYAVGIVQNNVDTGTLKFVAKPRSSGEQDVRILFKFDSRGLAGKILVSFVEVYRVSDGRLHAIGKDIWDEAESVYVPEIRTTLTDDNGDKELYADGMVTLVDEVMYKNLTPGKTYHMWGQIMVKEMKEDGSVSWHLLEDENAEQDVEFKPEFKDGTVSIEFEIDASELAGYTLVAFEKLTNEDNRFITDHEDINDEGQTVTFPRIRTHATNEEGIYKTIFAGPDQTVIDVVTYDNLIPGATYTMSGTLYVKATGEPVTNGGEPITAEQEFIADESGKGKVEMRFTFDATEYAAQPLVVGELLSNAVPQIRASHEDMDDEEQTTYVPEIGTTASAEDGTQRLLENIANGKIIDTIAYNGLVAGERYKVEGIVMDKATGEPLLINGKEVTGSTTFVAPATEGTVDVEFIVDNTSLPEGFLVVFESIYDMTDKLVAEHKDIDDEAQSVYTPARLKTTATGEDGEKILSFNINENIVTIVDVIEYSGLIPGEEYEVFGVLMDKETGEPILDSEGNQMISETTTFTPDEADGTVEVVFKVPGTDAAGKHAVAYEYMFRGELLVGSHEDIDDEDQTVLICCLVNIWKYDGTTDEGIEGVTLVISDKTAAQEAPVPHATSAENAVIKSPADKIKIEDLDDYSVMVTTDKDGYVEFAGVPGHEYVYREISCPEKYKLDNSLHKLKVEEDTSTSGEDTLLNNPEGTVIITKYDAMTGEGVAGATIEIKKDDRVVAVKVTNEKGEIYYFPEGPGKYTYVETKAPEGYYLNPDTYTFQVAADPVKVYIAAGNLSFMDAAEGIITITKVTDKGTKLQGAVIGLYTGNGQRIGSAISDADGKVYFAVPGPGDYYFMEESAPHGYMKNSETYKITITPNKVITGSTTLVNKPDDTPQTSDNSAYDAWKIFTAACSMLCVLSSAVLAVRTIRFKKGKHNA